MLGKFCPSTFLNKFYKSVDFAFNILSIFFLFLADAKLWIRAARKTIIISVMLCVGRPFVQMPLPGPRDQPNSASHFFITVPMSVPSVASAR
jgi:hypothetical protein